MKIKSDEFMFAKTSVVSDSASSSSVIIVPTDDPKLKVVIIPGDCLTQQSQSQSFQEQILATLTSLQILENVTKKQLYLPVFELANEASVPELEGIRLSETHRIKEAKIQSKIELAHHKF